LALAITKEEIPIAHEVYEGSKKHSKTVIDAVEKLKRRFRIVKLMFVADRGMVSPENIAYIKELEYDYIFSLRKRWLNEVKELFEPDLTRYERVEEEWRVRLYFREIKRGDIRYFVCRNPEVAEADLRKIEERRAKKEERIEEIMQKYKSASVIFKRIAKIYDVERYFKYWIKQDKVGYELN
jgi:transposase